MSLIITDGWGVAPGARILPVRVWNENDMIWGIDYVRLLRASDPSIRVINLSLGFDYGQYWYPCPCDEWRPASQEALSHALADGIVSFVATGNEAQCGEICPPACVSSTVRVAASYDHKYPTTDFGICGDFAPPAYWVTCFSNIAESCDYLLAAPGYDISVGGFDHYHGTSQATAHCSGVAALMFDKNGACGSLNAYSARTLIFNNASEHWWAYPHCPLPPPPRHVDALAAVNAVTPGPCGTPAEDLNCDSNIDIADFDGLAVCMTGPAGWTAGGCACADFPESPPDGDVDLRDFIHFQRVFSGGGSSPATVTLNLASPEVGQIVEPGGTIHWSVSATVSQNDNAGLAAISVDLVQDAGNRRHLDMPPATVVGAGMEGFNAPAGISNPETGLGVSGYKGTPVGTTGAKDLRQIGGAQNTFGETGHAGMGTDFTVDPGVGQTGPQLIAEGSFAAPTGAGTYVFRIENGRANVLNSIEPPPSPPASWPVSSASVVLDSSSFSVVVPYDLVAFDFDGDGDVDHEDFAHAQLCVAGPGAGVPTGCEDVDANLDEHVDGSDLVLFERCASGPDVAADGTCGDCDDDGTLDAQEVGTTGGQGDQDNDGILVTGRAPCTAGATTNCDDNCPCIANPDQADTDGDSIGDVCDQ